MWTLFLVAGASVLFVMIVWVVVTAIRIMRPEVEALCEADRLRLTRFRRSLVGARIPVPVRFGDIRELERERAHVGEGGEEPVYTWYEGYSLGIPVDWHADLQQRRN